MLDQSRASHLPSSPTCLVPARRRNPNLSFLFFDRLETDMVPTSDEKMPYGHMDADMSVTATWHGKGEVTRGLAQIVDQTDGLTYPGPKIIDGLPGLRNHLNLRFSNYKASRVYSWTNAEILMLQDYQARTTNRSGQSF
jgi:hypothetical protein